MKNNVKRLVKLASTFVLAVIMTLAIVGCSSYEAVSGDLPEGYEPDPSGKVKLQYYIVSTEADKRSVNDWVASFQKKYPNVQVEAELSNRGQAAIQAEIAAKSVGDVFFLWETDVYNYAVTQKALMPLDSYLEAYEIDTSNIFSAIYEMGVVQGKLYMTMRDYNHIIYYVNEDLIKSANLQDPVELEHEGQWDWDTFKQYCEVLTTTDEATGTKSVGASLRLGYAPEYIPFLEGWGGKWYDTENKKVNFVSDSNVLEGVNQMVDFVKSNTVQYVAVNGGSAVNETQDQKTFSGYSATSEIAFKSGEFPGFGSTGKAFDAAGVDWDVVSVPALPTHKVGTGATGFAVFNGTKNADAAAALCLSLYTEDGQKAYNGQEGGSVPNVRSLADADFWRVPFADNTNDPENGKNYYAFVSFPEADTYGQVECVLPPDIASIVKEYMMNVVPNAVNGRKSVADTLTALETEANEKWAIIFEG